MLNLFTHPKNSTNSERALAAYYKLDHEIKSTHIYRVDSDINNDCTGFYPASLNHVWLANSSDDDICLSNDLFRVSSSGMNNTDSSIFPLVT